MRGRIHFRTGARPLICFLILSLLMVSAVPIFASSARADTQQSFQYIGYETEPEHMLPGEQTEWSFEFTGPYNMNDAVNFTGWLIFSFNNSNSGGEAVMLVPGAVGVDSVNYSDFWVTVNAGVLLSPSATPGPMSVNIDFTCNGIREVQNLTMYINAPKPPLNVTATCNDTVGEGSLNAHFDSNVTEGHPPYNITWNFGDGTSSMLADPEHNYTKSGDYRAKFTVTDSFGFSTTKEVDIEVVAPLTVNLSYGAQTLSSADIHFTSNVTGGHPLWPWEMGPEYQYSWDFGDSYGSTLADPEHTYSQPGQYVVRLTVTSPNAKSVTEEMLITVNAQDTVPWGYILLGIGALAAGMAIGALSVNYLHKRKSPPN